MPRKSASALTTATPPGTKLRLAPPATLSDGARLAFAKAVSSVDADHFTAGDQALLVEFARAVDLANQAATELDAHGPVVNGRPSPWIVIQEKSVRALVALSARLRLCPQSRFDRTKAGTNARKPGAASVDELRARYEAEE
jgi:phage terminase small subunit